MSEIRKVKLGIILDSANAETAWREATGGPLPKIPDGCNTYTREFKCEGHPALLAIQSGFSNADGHENNGPMIVVAEDEECEADGWAAIREFIRRIETPHEPRRERRRE